MCATFRDRVRPMVLVAWLAAGARLTALESGPLVHRFPLTLEEGKRTEALGPLFAREDDEDTRMWAVHPVVSVESWKGQDRLSVDVLYPLFTYDRTGSEARWQLMQLLSGSRGADQEQRTTARWTLFPVLFWQRSEDPEREAFAFLPFYGHLEKRLFRDEIDVVLFPLWSRTRKREVVTENWFYPVYHRRYGPGLEGWQVWPFYGREEKVPTLQTNAWGETELSSGYRKRFVLWPVFFDVRTGLGTESPGHQRMFLPFYAESASERGRSRSWGWPLGVAVSTQSATGYREVGAPWPFVVWGDGPGRATHRFWPFYGISVRTNGQRQFLLWPLWQQRRSRTAGMERADTRMGLFVYREVEERLVEGRRLRRSLWPLFAHRQDELGRSRLQVLAPLEPVLPGNPGVERNYSALWSVWRAEEDPVTGRSGRSFLWNLWRWDGGPAGRKCSLLFGMVRYESDGDGSRWRLLGLPVWRRPAQPREGDKPVGVAGGALTPGRERERAAAAD
ncbi:hypothetical protein [Limisphaera sp. 4302-co]|uniref:hypothetical protein n=1 Tax=Limisphaera sp. 4302-co TaxID=3400417 RepID=UPI003C2BE528